MHYYARTCEIRNLLLAPMLAVMEEARRILDMEIDTSRIEELEEALSTYAHQSQPPSEQQSKPETINSSKMTRHNQFEPTASIETRLSSFTTPGGQSSFLQTAYSTNNSAFRAISPEPLAKKNDEHSITLENLIVNQQEKIHTQARTSGLLSKPETIENTPIQTLLPETSNEITHQKNTTTAEKLIVEHSLSNRIASAIPITESTSAILQDKQDASPDAVKSNAIKIPVSPNPGIPEKMNINHDGSSSVKFSANKYDANSTRSHPSGIPVRNTRNDKKYPPDISEQVNTPLLKQQVFAKATLAASAVEPSLEEAYQLTQTRLKTQETIEKEPSGLVSNTFNVSVSMNNDTTQNGIDRNALEEALTDILRTSARRHGLEV